MSKTCNGCGNESKKPTSVPYIVHESTVARMERIIKRQWIALIVSLCLIFACNAAWLYSWCQYDYSGKTYTEEIIVEQDAADGGNANYVGNDGDIINGVSKSDNS